MKYMEKISFVIPCYHSEHTVGGVVDEIVQTVTAHGGYDYEIILVNDNSPDNVIDTITELAKAKINAAVKVGLMSEKAVDVDYLTYKLVEKCEKLELDEQGNIKGWSDKISALKTQFPTMFEGKTNGSFDGYRPIEKGTNPEIQTLTRADILKKPYSERVKLFNENPDNYSQIMKG